MGFFKRTHEEKVARHEAKVFKAFTYDFDNTEGYTYPFYPKIARFIKEDDGAVYDRSGRYHYSRELWERRMNEFRLPRAEHSFYPANEAVNVEVINGQAWPDRAMVCTRCGERRGRVSLFVDTNRLNRGGWCVDPKMRRDHEDANAYRV